MKKRTAADFLIETLIISGVERIYGICGDSLNGVTEAIRVREQKPAWVHVRHEEVAAFAAAGEAHVSGALAVCAGSCGPGNLHLINGLYDAYRSRVPVLAIAAQIPMAELGGSYFQETHPETVFAECSHFCALVSVASELPRLLRLAIAAAVEEQGVAVLILPGDVALTMIEHTPQSLPIMRAITSTTPSAGQVQAAADVLNKAGKVTILAGAGAAEAKAELFAVAKALQAPIVHTLRGKEALEGNSFDVGLTGLIGHSSGYHAMAAADALLLVGTDFPYRQFIPSVPVVQIDLRGEHIGRRAEVTAGVVGDAAVSLAQLSSRLRPQASDVHLRQALAHYLESRAQHIQLGVSPTGKMAEAQPHPQYVASLANDYAAGDAVFTCDVGTPTIWAARYIQMQGRRRLIGSFNHGSMACALPLAIGAQSLHPQRQVVAMCGDGGLAMLMGDLLTLVQQQLPVKVIVFNNGALAFVELEMMSVGFQPNATDLKNPNFAKVADAIGLLGIRVDKASELAGAMKTAFAHPGPALLDIVVPANELSMPPHISAEQVKGFGLFSLKVVLSGHTKELVDLARTNLWGH